MIQYEHFKQLFIDLLSEKSELIVSVSSMIVAIIALVVAIRRDKRLQNHQRLSVKPILVIVRKASSTKDKLSLSIHNKGLGPALIHDFEISYLNESHSFPNFENYKNLGLKVAVDTIFDFRNYQFDKNEVILPGEKIEFLRILFKKGYSEKFWEVRDRFNKVRVKVDYKSFYDESFCIIKDGI